MFKRRKEIYKEMDDFIGFLRKSESPERFSIFKKKKKKEKIEPKPEFTEIPVEEAKIEPELEEETKEEKKIGFLSFMANLFKREREKEEEELEDLPEESVKLELYKTQMQDDAKKALKIADKLIKKIPNFELRKFTQSEDYEVYESVMKKYGLR